MSDAPAITSLTDLAPQAVLPAGAVARALGDARFALEAAAAREEAERWLSAFDRLSSVAAGTGRLAVAKREAAALGVSVSRFNNRVSAYRQTGSWETFIDRRKFPKVGNQGVPPEFIEFCRTLASEFQRDRSLKRAWVALLSRLDRWCQSHDPKDAIPGYSTPPARLRTTGLPRGWSRPHFARYA